jgi:hypothetical protein
VFRGDGDPVAPRHLSCGWSVGCRRRMRWRQAATRVLLTHDDDGTRAAAGSRVHHERTTDRGIGWSFFLPKIIFYFGFEWRIVRIDARISPRGL